MLTLTSPSNNRKRSSSGGRGGRATGNGGGGGASSSTSSYQLLPLVIVDPSRFETMREWGRGGWVCAVGWFLVSVSFIFLFKNALSQWIFHVSIKIAISALLENGRKLTQGAEFNNGG